MARLSKKKLWFRAHEPELYIAFLAAQARAGNKTSAKELTKFQSEKKNG